ncbi:hypothetical protein MD484_g6100, partial [Candolleomyces efflorescens]
MQGNEPPIAEQLVQMSIYARQIFIHQPNRRFARVLAISERYIRLFHFDRSGVQYTPLLDFHEEPHTFVRLVLGLNSTNELDVGLDTSIQWTIDGGRKAEGTITVSGDGLQDTVYPLAQIEPFLFRGSITGRSTTCWKVRDPDTNEQLFVKDMWREEDRPSEHAFLQDAIGLPGVAQMVNCEPDLCQTKSLRGLGGNEPASFRNRIESRIVLKAYGKSLDQYSSATQLFCALRDAIAGHLELFKKGTLHRDVSPYNILFGTPEAEKGNLGILIDLDIAIRRSWNKLTDEQIGMRLYQSVAVLRSATVPAPFPYDHLDDLESFLYVVVHLMFTRDSNGQAYAGSNMLSEWDAVSHNCRLAAALKGAYLGSEFLPEEVEQNWPSPCVDLVLAYTAFIYSNMKLKMKLSQIKERARKGKDKVFAANALQHYAHILQLFDTAIEALDRPDTWRVSESDGPYSESSSTGSTSTVLSIEKRLEQYEQMEQRFSSSSSGRSWKRASNGDTEDQPSPKRCRSHSSSSISESDSASGRSTRSSRSSNSVPDSTPHRRTRRSARNPVT